MIRASDTLNQILQNLNLIENKTNLNKIKLKTFMNKIRNLSTFTIFFSSSFKP